MNDTEVGKRTVAGVRDVARVVRPDERQGEPPVPLASWGRKAGWGVLAAGVIMLLGVLIDLGILWIFQREASPQWEFTAVANTVESVPRLAFGLGFIFVALYMLGSTSTFWYRVTGVALVGVGVLAIALAALQVLSYFPLAKLVRDPAAYGLLRSVAMKTIALCGLYAVVAVPLGVLSLRRPRR